MFRNMEKMSAERAQEIISGISGSAALKDLVPDHERRAFAKFLQENVWAQNAYDLAQKTRAEFYADEIVDIADNELDPQRARNRIDARKWYASRLQPNKYGDRIDLNVTQTLDISAALTAAATRLLPMRYPEEIEDAQLVETKQLECKTVTDSESVSPEKPSKLRVDDVLG